MIKKMLGRIAASTIAVILAAAIMCFPVFAAGDTCELYIPVVISDSGGNVPEGTIFTVEIKSETGAPLPEKTTLTVDVSGNCQFGPILFDEPGNYEYTISEHKVTQDKVITDDTVYDVHAAAMYNDKGEMVGLFSLTKHGSTAKPTSVEFRNSGFDVHGNEDDPSEQQSSVPEEKPQTGADLSYAYPAVLLPILIVLAVIALFRRRSDDECDRINAPPGIKRESG